MMETWTPSDYGFLTKCRAMEGGMTITELYGRKDGKCLLVGKEYHLMRLHGRIVMMLHKSFLISHLVNKVSLERESNDRPPIAIQYSRRKTSGIARAQVMELEEVETTLVGTTVSYRGEVKRERWKERWGLVNQFLEVEGLYFLERRITEVVQLL